MAELGREASTGFVACPLLCGSCIVAVLVLVVIELAIYGYSNPDPSECWYIDGLDETYLSRAEAIAAAEKKGIDIPDNEPVNVH